MDISRCFGYTAATVSALFYSGSVATAQLLGNMFPRFELNLFRLTGTLLVCLVSVAVKRQPVFVVSGVRDIMLILGGACAYTWMVLSLNLAPLYAPVGNLESVAITVYVVLTVMVSVCQRKASWAIIAGAFISCVGVVLLTQPDFLFTNNHDSAFIKDPCPCAGMTSADMTSRSARCYVTDGRLQHKSSTQLRVNFSDVISTFATNHDPLDLTPNVTSPGYENVTAKASSNDVILRLPGIGDETFGYLLSVSTGITLLIFTQIDEKLLLPMYGFLVVTFWYGVIGSALSVVLMLSLETPVVTRISSCVWMTTLHGVFASTHLILQNFSLCHMGADENSIILTTTVAELFIAQATFLKRYQPTHGNVYEYVGAVFVILACLLEPIYQMVKARMGKTQEVSKDDPSHAPDDFEHDDDHITEETALLQDQ